MFFRAWNTAIGDMGYALSRLEIDPDYSDSESSLVGDDHDSPRPSSQNDLDHEVAQLTKIRSAPHERLKRVLPRREEFPVSPVKMLAGREGNYSGRGRFSSADQCHLLNKYLPVKGPSTIDQLTTRAYVSQFSNDGSLFVAAFQGSHIKVYNAEMGWKLQKNIVARSLRWTITDTSLSPDKRFLVYATMSPMVNIVNIGSAATESHANVTEIHEGLEFSGDDEGGYSFGIFSVKFSNDGKELVAGSSDDSIYVYDIEANKLSLRIQAHTSDVNSVCFADETSHLIYSGSDDNLCKVWDRRCFRSKGKPAGILVGHLEGITHLDSRNDGRYFISNGKDQTIKLWDIRKMSPNAIHTPGFRNYEWDYRWMDYPLRARDVKHPNDQSVSTYKGHSVLRTLIRCYFSPEYSTGQKYIYTGSHDSCVYVYDLVSGAQVARLVHHKSTVRDCSWHPYYPMLVSSSFDGDIAKWEFPGNADAPIPVNTSRPRRQHFD
uniref:LEC14B protein n=1 Tax=Erigeron canadensis TaxID=72917 RepID=UPI001CB9C3E3|nr:LEC14B protein [Erigeron canadensis]